MRYSDVKRLVDELFRQFLRTVDKRLKKVESREVTIRMGQYGGDVPEQWGPAYTFDRNYQIYKVNVGATAGTYSFTITGDITTAAITNSTTFPHFLPTPVKWLKDQKLQVDLGSSSGLEDFEIVLTAREV